MFPASQIYIYQIPRRPPPACAVGACLWLPALPGCPLFFDASECPTTTSFQTPPEPNRPGPWPDQVLIHPNQPTDGPPSIDTLANFEPVGRSQELLREVRCLSRGRRVARRRLVGDDAHDGDSDTPLPLPHLAPCCLAWVGVACSASSPMHGVRPCAVPSPTASLDRIQCPLLGPAGRLGRGGGRGGVESGGRRDGHHLVIQFTRTHFSPPPPIRTGTAPEQQQHGWGR